MNITHIKAIDRYSGKTYTWEWFASERVLEIILHNSNLQIKEVNHKPYAMRDKVS